MLSDITWYYQILSGKIREGGTPPVGSPGGKLRGGGYPPTRFFLDGRMGGSLLAVTGVILERQTDHMNILSPRLATFPSPLLAEMFGSRLRPEACSGNPFFLLIWRGFKPHTRKQGQFMSATRLGIVSSTTKFRSLHDSLPSTQGNFTCLQYSADRPWPFSHTTGLQSFVFFSYLMAVLLRNRRQVDSDHRIRVLIVW